MKEINIAIVGKTGHGKSSTGNTILQRIVFEESCNATDGTRLVDLKRVDIGDNTKLNVYDTPGVMSLLFEEKQNKGVFRRQIDKLLEDAKKIHVFVFVFNFMCRFTQEEKEAVKQLNHLLQDNFIRNHGMIVVTHGDNCEDKAIKANISTQDMFKDWCEKSGEFFVKLISEAGENIILVNNKDDFSPTSKRLKSSEELRDMIKIISEKHDPFTKEKYESNYSCVIL